MKILFVSATFRKDLEKWVHGIYIRMGMFVEAMKTLGQLDMIFYIDDRIPITKGYVREVESHLMSRWDTKLTLTLCHLEPSRLPQGRWQTIVGPALSIYNHPVYARISGREQIDTFDQNVSKGFDVVFVHRLLAMCPVMNTKRLLPPICFDLDDIEHLTFLRNLRNPPWWFAKRLRYIQVPSLLFGERRAIKSAHRTFVCSDHDRKYLTRPLGLRNVVTIPNTVEIPEEQEMTTKPNLMFIGSFEYPPNALAAEHLVKDIWPLIRSVVPYSELIIVGESPQNIPSFHRAHKNVRFCGFAKDLASIYKNTRAVCCPVLSGGGTRLKILEACSYGKPVVSTNIGAEGLNLVNGSEIFLHEDPGSFAEACILLLKDRDLASKIGRAARSAVAQRFGRREILAKIRSNVTSLLKDGTTLN